MAELGSPTLVAIRLADGTVNTDVVADPSSIPGGPSLRGIIGFTGDGPYLYAGEHRLRRALGLLTGPRLDHTTAAPH